MIDLKKAVRFVLAVIAVVGGLVFLLDLTTLIRLPDILELYYLCGFFVGGVMFLTTMEHFSKDAGSDYRLNNYSYRLWKKAWRDGRREERNYQKLSKKHSMS